MSNEELVERIQSGEDVQNNMLKLWQQNLDKQHRKGCT